ncbi:uncharacterized protein BDV14DRAFT_162291 [Aspergillus stella-maris]|uniref:uncharacterized protein n=1 Tax=Aspergillus stella-maris TaxID=1810926 RepID=UPI003CCCD573
MITQFIAPAATHPSCKATAHCMQGDRSSTVCLWLKPHFKPRVAEVEAQATTNADFPSFALNISIPLCLSRASSHPNQLAVGVSLSVSVWRLSGTDSPTWFPPPPHSRLRQHSNRFLLNLGKPQHWQSLASGDNHTPRHEDNRAQDSRRVDMLQMRSPQRASSKQVQKLQQWKMQHVHERR